MDNYTLLSEQWPEILQYLKTDADITSLSFDTWIAPLQLKSADSEGFLLYVPMGDMGINLLNKKYSNLICSAVKKATGLNLNVHYTDQENIARIKETEQDNDFQEIMDRAHLEPKYTFESFVVGSNNKFAHAASLAVAESPGAIYNPLYLYAGVGLGKTHLMHSIAHFILKHNPDAQVLYVTSETFTNELIDSIRNGNTSAMTNFRKKYRNIDVLLIDDIQFIMGKESTQEEFFHTFETLYGQKKQIIVSSDKPPKDLDILEERIRSRLEMGLIADISSPDYETRMAILKKKQEIEGYEIDDQVLDYIAKSIKSNIRELEGCLNQVHAKAVLEKCEVDLPMAEVILHDLISTDDQKTLTSEKIISTTADYFHLSLQDLKSSRRDKKISNPRLIAMYLCREMTEDAYVTIANLLNRKDHTTVISACKKIDNEILVNSNTKRAVEEIRKKLQPS